ncbi:hypothetical protein [Flavobacterium sp. RSSB_23]|uniref:hypothetical protein n=1 Tax=Flavobacterium sp. RSSB_23 TaxID=3447668 RepID=UPI003F3FC6D7
MNGLQDMVFLGEIVLQVKIARKANERLKATHNNLDNVEVWCSIQSILVAAANVSKILLPPNKKYKSRGERLQKILEIEQGNILFDRKFRNHFEHYDERIEEYFNINQQVVYVDLVMNPMFGGRMLSNTHRGYNSFDNTVVFRNETLALNEVLNALEEVFEKCKPYTLT